ncbi:alpha/beta fold hydrolase [Mycolicibacterium iranicum]|uniref:Hydrolase n=1 Tax=Mycolicibacterium iranicum TaxID=912594 RepID=A0A178LTF5_MYCIR|nr:alpha/beta hydrolase [Mycolicibacterium iranicum]OAN37342.1 hydrolase [Mycolicibacterium iranicum]
MASAGSPVVLLHGILMSGNAWRDVVPLLADRHRVHTPTTAGHRGGPALHRSPATVKDLVDAVERYLDGHRLDRPHVVGLSLGGWMAVELARRGRAATVCALAPAGFWSPGDRAQAHVLNEIHKFVAMGRLARSTRPLVSLAMRSAIVRRVGFRKAAQHGDRLSTSKSIQAVDDISGCDLNVDDILGSDEFLAPLDPVPCPVTIAWSGSDSIIPVPMCDPIARERLPGASFTTLPGVGHVPMIDDPRLVARTILAVTASGRSGAS